MKSFGALVRESIRTLCTLFITYRGKMSLELKYLSVKESYS